MHTKMHPKSEKAFANQLKKMHDTRLEKSRETDQKTMHETLKVSLKGIVSLCFKLRIEKWNKTDEVDEMSISSLATEATGTARKRGRLM